VVLPFVISVGATISISILGIPSAGNQSVLGIIGGGSVSQEFIYYSIQNYKGTLYGHATGGAQQHINKNNVDNLYILVPENTMLEKFNNSVTIMFDQLIINSKENQLLSQSRDLLLPRLMNGKLRVK
jgi:type I restriction enzyme S subunit